MQFSSRLVYSASVLTWTWLSSSAAADLDVGSLAQQGAAHSVPAPDQLESVVVEANEPRYVAPTLRDRIGRIWAPVLINGKGPFRLVLDTGANSSAIIPSVADQLGIPLVDTKVVRLHGVTGSAAVPLVQVETMEVGDLLIDDPRLPVVADVFGGAEGVLGGRGLNDKRIFIDFRNDRIQISRSRNQATPSGFTRIPIDTSRGQLPMMDISIGSIRTKAILDTGAQRTIGNNSLREALLRRQRESLDEKIVGVTLDVADGQSIAVPPITLGGVSVRNARIVFGDMFIFDKWDLADTPALLIGMDVIGTLDVLVIDYKRRELQVRTRS
jgi:predicted aspartyl protease